jgi:hypothetical protein
VRGLPSGLLTTGPHGLLLEQQLAASSGRRAGYRLYNALSIGIQFAAKEGRLWKHGRGGPSCGFSC